MNNLHTTKLTTGFTLIELLVVIAIIGMLTSVVLASLATARNKGADASVKSGLSTLRSQAQIFWDTNGGQYNSICTDATFLRIWNATGAIGLGTAGCNSSNGGTGTWAAETALKTAGYWCVDSSGAARAEVSSLAVGVVLCP